MTHRKNPGDDPWAWRDQPRTGPDLRLVPSLDPRRGCETGAAPG